MDQPPARAKPFTAAMRGFHVCGHIYGLSEDMLWDAGAGTPSAVALARSFRSRPAQKARPAPVIIATKESSSLSNWVMASANSRRNWRLMEFYAAGRLRVIVTILPDFS